MPDQTFHIFKASSKYVYVVLKRWFADFEAEYCERCGRVAWVLLQSSAPILFLRVVAGRHLTRLARLVSWWMPGLSAEITLRDNLGEQLKQSGSKSFSQLAEVCYAVWMRKEIICRNDGFIFWAQEKDQEDSEASNNLMWGGKVRKKWYMIPINFCVRHNFSGEKRIRFTCLRKKRKRS